MSKTAAAVRLADGGKLASKQVQAGYKLAMRYAKVAEFLEKHGLTFAAIGEVIGEKQTFSINMAERATRSDSDDAGTKAFATTWQMLNCGSLVSRCVQAEKAEQDARDNAIADAGAALKEKYFAEFEAARTQAETAPKATKRIAEKIAA